MADDKVYFEKLEEDAQVPERQHSNDVGYDLHASEPVKIPQGEVKMVPTGLKMKLPKDVEAQVRPRSGLSLSGLSVLNSPGTIDPGYRGEVKVIMANLLGDDFQVEKGDRIAQMVFNKVEHPEVIEGSLDETERGEGGFGSTGK